MLAVLEPALDYTSEIAAETAPIFDKLSDIISPIEWPGMAPYISAINRLKKEKNAVILAHNYQTPEIFHGVADIVGDSLALAIEAEKTDADIIIMAGVHFMAETAKLVNPSKTVLIPDPRAGCSLAESITADDIRLLREKYPGVPVVTYVNTSADVKAESDICCTSGNAVHIVESLNVPEVICLPDEYLADWIAGQTKVKIIKWKGHCEVHERFTPADIQFYRDLDPSLVVLAHPECPPNVLAAADYVGSTAGMIKYVDQKRPKKVVMVTECAMGDNVAVNFPDVQFMRPCNLCPHMQRITLPKIYEALLYNQFEVKIADDLAARARLPIDRMITAGRN